MTQLRAKGRNPEIGNAAKKLQMLGLVACVCVCVRACVRACEKDHLYGTVVVS